MPISSLTASQQQVLANAINAYVQDQLKLSNFLVFNQIRTATTVQIQNALSPYLTKQLTAAQAALSNLAAAQAAETTAVNQAVTDVQAVIANLS